MPDNSEQLLSELLELFFTQLTLVGAFGLFKLTPPRYSIARSSASNVCPFLKVVLTIKHMPAALRAPFQGDPSL